MSVTPPLLAVNLDLVKYEGYRVQTFIGKWTNTCVSPNDLAKAGLYYRGGGDNVQCAFCGGRLLNWVLNDDPNIEHRKHYPHCRFMLGEEVGNVSIERENDENVEQSLVKTKEEVVDKNGIIRARSLHPNYAIELKREKSFKKWPKKAIIDPKSLSRAGFFYVGYSDNVKCFFCDGGLRNWAAGDDPWKEHVRWFSTCGYVLLHYNAGEIDRIKETYNADNILAKSKAGTPHSTDWNELTDPRLVNARLDTKIVKSIIRLGFSKILVKKVLEVRLLTNGDDFPSAKELLKAVFEADDLQKMEYLSEKERKRSTMNLKTGSGNDDDFDDDDLKIDSILLNDPDIQRLITVYEKIKDEKLCKICVADDCTIMFFPCGHLVCCSSCAPALRNCPICRTYIKGSARVYTS